MVLNTSPCVFTIEDDVRALIERAPVALHSMLT
jgi:hypothetical protein